MQFLFKTFLVATHSMPLWTRHRPLHYLCFWYAWCPGYIPARSNSTLLVSDFCFSSCGWRWGDCDLWRQALGVWWYPNIHQNAQCQNESKALLFNSEVIYLLLVKLLWEVWNRVIYPIFSNLHENSTTPYVTSIYGQLELFLKVWCYQNWFTDQYGFDFVDTIFSFIWPNIFDILCQQVCQWNGHIRKILTKLPVISSNT